MLMVKFSSSVFMLPRGVPLTPRQDKPSRIHSSLLLAADQLLRALKSLALKFWGVAEPTMLRTQT